LLHLYALFSTDSMPILNICTLYYFTGYISGCSHHTECMCRYERSGKFPAYSNWISLSYTSQTTNS